MINDNGCDVTILEFKSPFYDSHRHMYSALHHHTIVI